jgi:hypothetical protein
MATRQAIQPRKYGRDLEVLNPKQRFFVENLLADRDFNATKAAQLAGYKAPATSACQLLKNKVVGAAIGKAIQERIYECKVTANQVLRELCSIGFFNPKRLLTETGTLIELKDLPDEIAGAIKSMEISFEESITEEGTPCKIRNVKFLFYDKVAALGLLMKHLGMELAQKHEHQVTVGVKEGINWEELYKTFPDPTKVIEAQIVGALSGTNGNGDQKALAGP